MADFTPPLFLFNPHKLRLSLPEHRKVIKAGVFKYRRNFCKIKCNMFRFVGVGTDREDIAAKFPVPPEDLLSWIWEAKTVLAAAGVQLGPFSEGDKFS